MTPSTRQTTTAGALLFDVYGTSIPAGGAPLDDLDLRAWPGCRMITEIGSGPREIGRVLVLGDDPTIPREMLAQLVAAVEGGEDVVLHAYDEDAVLAAEATILGMLGGGHA